MQSHKIATRVPVRKGFLQLASSSAPPKDSSMPKKLRQEMQALLVELEYLHDLERAAEQRRQQLLLAREQLRVRLEEAERIRRRILEKRTQDARGPGVNLYT